MITPDEAIRYATHPNELKLHLSGINDSSNRAWASVEMGALERKEQGIESGMPEWIDRNADKVERRSA
jgi:hypothetical protein